MKRNILLFLVLLFLLFLNGCMTSSPSEIKYQCADGSFVDSPDKCSPKTYPEIKCPELNCSVCPTRIETRTVINTSYVCSDLKEVTNKEDCLKTDSEGWYEVKTFSGNGVKNTETFNIPSKEWKISWETRAGELGLILFQIFVYKETNEFVGVAANVAADSDSDYSILRGSGDYYLTINTVQPYTVTIEAKK